MFLSFILLIVIGLILSVIYADTEGKPSPFEMDELRKKFWMFLK